jgi:hypothetical protein
MMPPSQLRPKWWQLYLTFPLLVLLFVLDGRLKLTPREHQALQVGILLLVYGLIYLWLHINALALANTDGQQNSRRILVIHMPISQLPDADGRSIMDLPEAEIKGVLSDTFEIEYIEAESLPLEDIPPELKKE